MLILSYFFSRFYVEICNLGLGFTGFSLSKKKKNRPQFPHQGDYPVGVYVQETELSPPAVHNGTA